MPSTYTGNLRLAKPSTQDRGWGDTLNGVFDSLDRLAPLGSLAVTPAESPSTSLNVRVTAGSYRQSGGTVAAFGGQNPVAVPAGATSCVFLDDAGTLAVASAWPWFPHVRLATVVAGSGTITSVADARVTLGSVGAAPQIRSITVTADYSATAIDGQIRVNAAGGPVTVPLPGASAVPGQVVRVAKVDTSGNAVTVASSSPINGAGSYLLSSQWAARTFVADGTSNTWTAY